MSRDLLIALAVSVLAVILGVAIQPVLLLLVVFAIVYLFARRHAHSVH